MPDWYVTAAPPEAEACRMAAVPRKQASKAVTAAMTRVRGLVSAAFGAARHGIVTLGPPGAPTSPAWIRTLPVMALRRQEGITVCC